MKRLAVLGATGSIGQQTLEIVRKYPNDFQVTALGCQQNVDTAVKLAQEFKPKYLAVGSRQAGLKIKPFVPKQTVLLLGQEEVAKLAAADEVDLVVNAVVGSAGLQVTLAALKSRKILALANKESLVVGGRLVQKALEQSQATILPVDSEHNALFQCLTGESLTEVANLIITASGGPFLNFTEEQLKKVTVTEALAHPRWQMGAKITVDSATLMNKAFEVIEAHYLFKLPYEKIKVLIHPQSLIHGLAEFVDGSIKAHLGPTDMRTAILYCLGYPQRKPGLVRLDLAKLPVLELRPLNPNKFKCYKMALQAIKASEGHLVALNAANEEAVQAFLQEKISFLTIADVIEFVLAKQAAASVNSYNEFLAIDKESRQNARLFIKRGLK